MTPAALPGRYRITLLVLAALLAWFAVDSFSPLPSAQEQRDQGLIDAIRSRDALAAERLIAQGANPNICDDYRRPSLTSGVSLPAIAAAQDDIPTLTLLLAHGANVNVSSDSVDWNAHLRPGAVSRAEAADDDFALYSWRTTPLIEAVRHDNLVAARLLLDRGAAVNAKNDSGMTALMAAVRYSRPAATQMLLQRGADPSAASSQGWTALMTAAWAGRTHIAQLLIAAGANVNAQDRQGDTPLGEAMQGKQTEVAALLKAHGARFAPLVQPVALPLPPPPASVIAPPPKVVPPRKLPSGPLPALSVRAGGAAFARPVPGMRGHSLKSVSQGELLWASPTELLMSQEPYRFMLLDIETGRTTFLPGLSALLQGQLWGSYPAWCLSSDRQWLLGKTQQGWFAASVRGNEVHRWPGDGTEPAQIGWLPDGRHWIQSYYEPNTIIISIYSLDSSAVQQPPVILTLPTLVNNLTVSSYPAVMMAGNISDPMHPASLSHFATGVTRFGLVPIGSGWTIRCSELSVRLLQPKEEFLGCAQTPRDGRLAWAVQSPKAIRFYVSRSDGSQMRLVFETSRAWPIQTQNVDWTPDGKRLIFWCGDVLYTVPA